MSNLLEQWNEHIIRGNQLSRELEDIEDLLSKASEADICFSSGNNGAIFIRVLSPEKMQEIKESAMIAIMGIRNEKEEELQKLMGKQQVIPAYGEINIPEKHKPTIINPEFEEAVKSMVDSVKKKPDPVESKPVVIPKTESKRIEDKPVDTDPSMDKYPAKKDKRIKASENMTEADIRRMYIDDGKDRKEIAKFYGVSEGKINNYLYLHDIKRKKVSKPDKNPAETECP